MSRRRSFVIAAVAVVAVLAVGCSDSDDSAESGGDTTTTTTEETTTTTEEPAGPGAAIAVPVCEFLGVTDAEASGREAVLVCAPGLRPALRRTVVLMLPRLPVLSYSEVTGAGLRIETVGVLSDAQAIAA